MILYTCNILIMEPCKTNMLYHSTTYNISIIEPCKTTMLYCSTTETLTEQKHMVCNTMIHTGLFLESRLSLCNIHDQVVQIVTSTHNVFKQSLPIVSLNKADTNTKLNSLLPGSLSHRVHTTESKLQYST